VGCAEAWCGWAVAGALLIAGVFGCGQSERAASGTGTGAGAGAGTGGFGGAGGLGGTGAAPATGGAGGTAGIAEQDGGQLAPVDGGTRADAMVTEDAGALRLPPVNGALDYQLGGAYPPPDAVNVVSRDRTEAPAPGLYNLCYVNGFQVQPGEMGSWDADLILRDAGGDPVIDEDWDEALLDVGTADKRSRIAAVIGGWIASCAADGFDAVEVDNLDSYSRSGGLLDEDAAVAFMQLLSAAAHAEGLAIAQKNSTELLGRRAELGTDFSVAEECSRWDECGDYVAAYGAAVLMIEYRSQDFAAGCAAYGASHAIVLRDLNLVPEGQPGYVFDGC
jgi:hypothetical protein